MNKAKLFVLGMALGFNRDHEIFEGIEFDEDMADLLLEGGKISKSDVFSVAPNGKSVFEYKETWEKLDKIMTLLEKSGEDIRYSDLKKNIKNSKSAMDMAIACDAMAAVFKPELWKDRLEDFETFYFSVPKDKRGNISFDEVREQVAVLSGIKTRYAELKEMGLKPADIRAAFSGGDLDKIVAEMAEKGTHLKLEDAKFCDADGDHALYSKASWEKFEKTYAALEAVGEVPDAAFFFFKRGNRKSVIEVAFQHDSADKIFNAKVFKERPDVLMQVYDRLDDIQKSKVDIDRVLVDVIETQVDMDFLVSSDIGADDLLAPIFNEAASKVLPHPVIALALEKTWQNMDKIAKNLEQKGQTIKLDALRQVSGRDGETCLMKAARFGHFDKVMNLLKMSGERLTADDFLAKTEDGKCLLDVIQENDGLESLIDASYWAGHADELVNTVWKNLNAIPQTKYLDEFRTLLTACNIETLKREHFQPKPIYFP